MSSLEAHINEFLVGGRGMTLETLAESGVLLDEALLQLRSCGLMASGAVATGTCSSVADCIVDEAGRWSADCATTALSFTFCLTFYYYMLHSTLALLRTYPFRDRLQY